MIQKDKAAEPGNNQWLEMYVLPEEDMLLYLLGGEDITEKLEAYMRELGVNLLIKFKSPCG